MVTSLKKSFKDKDDDWEGTNIITELKVRVSIDFKDSENRDFIIAKAIKNMSALIAEIKFFKFGVRGKILNVQRVIESGDSRSYNDNLPKIKRPKGGLVK